MQYPESNAGGQAAQFNDYIVFLRYHAAVSCYGIFWSILAFFNQIVMKLLSTAIKSNQNHKYSRICRTGVVPTRYPVQQNNV